MISAFFYRYSLVLLRNPADTAAMFVRPLLSGVLLLIFAQTVTGKESLPQFMVASVIISNIITNAVLGAAYEARMDLEHDKRHLIELAPGGLPRYGLIQSATQCAIATLQSLVVWLALLPWLRLSLNPTPVFGVACLILFAAVVTVGALAACRSAIRKSYVGVSFGLGIVLAFSGVFYPIEALPPWLQAVSSANPVTYVIAGVRSGFGAYPASPWFGLAYAGIVTVAAMVLLGQLSKTAPTASPA